MSFPTYERKRAPEPKGKGRPRINPPKVPPLERRVSWKTRAPCSMCDRPGVMTLVVGTRRDRGPREHRCAEHNPLGAKA